MNPWIVIQDFLNQLDSGSAPGGLLQPLPAFRAVPWDAMPPR